jgi:hypothetical protein
MNARNRPRVLRVVWLAMLIAPVAGCKKHHCVSTPPTEWGARIERVNELLAKEPEDVSRQDPHPGSEVASAHVVMISLEKALRRECRLASKAERSDRIQLWRRAASAARRTETLSDETRYRFSVFVGTTCKDHQAVLGRLPENSSPPISTSPSQSESQ